MTVSQNFKLYESKFDTFTPYIILVIYIHYKDTLNIETIFARI